MLLRHLGQIQGVAGHSQCVEAKIHNRREERRQMWYFTFFQWEKVWFNRVATCQLCSEAALRFKICGSSFFWTFPPGARKLWMGLELLTTTNRLTQNLSADRLFLVSKRYSAYPNCKTHTARGYLSCQEIQRASDSTYAVTGNDSMVVKAQSWIPVPWKEFH